MSEEEEDNLRINEDNKDDQGMELLDNINDDGIKKNQFGDIGFAKEKYNQSINFNQQNLHDKIARNLESNDEDDENNDADPEDLIPKQPAEMNKTLDDIFTAQMFGIKDPNEKIVPFDSRKAGMFERMLHPMQYGSLRGSIFALSSMCLETGALILAVSCKNLGLIPFLLCVIGGGVLAYWTLTMMIKAARNMKEREYSKVVKATLGNKVGVFLDCNITLYLFGALISFQVIIYKLIGSFVYDIQLTRNQIDNKSFDDFFKDVFENNMLLKSGITFGIILLLFPLCLLKDVSKMRFASLIGVLALAYSIIVIMIESPFFAYSNKELLSQINWFDFRDAFKPKTGFAFFSCMSTVFYLYSCHAGAFPVYKTLRNNTTRRIKKVFRRSIILDIVIYFCVAAASYLTNPKDPPELIVFRDPLNNFKNDYFMMLAKIGVIFDLFFSTPANYAALRISVFELIWGNTNITNVKNFIVTGGFFIVIGTIAIVYSDVLTYIELLGGFCSVIYCILIPGLIYVKNNKLSWNTVHNLVVLAVVILFTIIGYTSGILTILYNMVKIGEK